MVRDKIKCPICGADKKYEQSRKWHSPTCASCYQQNFFIRLSDDKTCKLRKNLSYSLKYIELLEGLMETENSSHVVKQMWYKTYITTAATIIMDVLAGIVHHYGKVSGEDAPYEYLRNSAMTHLDVLNENRQLVKDLNTLQKLNERTKVNQKKEASLEGGGNLFLGADFITYHESVIPLARKSLLALLSSKQVSKDTQVYGFLQK